jgi:hypothetical protein
MGRFVCDLPPVRSREGKSRQASRRPVLERPPIIFWKCDACGGWFDMRDLGAGLDQEEPLPHLSGHQVYHRRGIISAASSGVGAMRRGHCACEVRGPPRSRARPYSCFVLERRNSAIMLPKLYIVPLLELLGIFHRGLIVGAHKSNCSADKTVFVHDVSSILGHIGVTPKSLRTTSIPSLLSRFRILKP